jgi:hypothetical protein
MTHYDTIIFTDFTDPVLTVKALGPYKIASELRRAGYSCLVVDHFSRWSLDELDQLINATIGPSTLFVGFGTTFMQDVPVVTDSNQPVRYNDYNSNITFCPQGKDFENKLVNKIRKVNNNIKILLGGYKLSDQCSNRNVDIVVKGLAEISIVELADDLKNAHPLRNSSRNVWGRTVIFKDQEKEYNFANSCMRWEPADVVNTRVLPLEPARGCIFNCKFCSFPQRGKKTLDYVIAEELLYQELLENYQRYGITTYQLLDDTFNDSDEKLDRIHRVVDRLPFQPVFWAYNRLDLLAVKPNRIQKLYDVGLRATSFGIETLTADAGKIVGKGFDPERQIDTIREIRSRFDNKLLMHGLFIIGLPRESMDAVDRTFQRILSEDIPLHSTYFEALYIRRRDSSWNLSEFDLNWQNYGYEDQDPTTPVWINWKNEHTTHEQAIAKKNEFIPQIFGNDRFHIPGQTAWSLMNYPKFNLDRIQNLKNSQVDWAEVTQSKLDFVTEYKTQLFKILGISL